METEWEMNPALMYIAMVFMFIICIVGVVMYGSTFPTTVQGKVVFVEYTVFPYPSTEICFTTFGYESETLTLYGTVAVETGKTYRVTYYHPLFHMMNNLILLEEM